MEASVEAVVEAFLVLVLGDFFLADFFSMEAAISSMKAFTEASAEAMEAFMEAMEASMEAVEASMEAAEASTEAFMNFHAKDK